MTKVLVTGGTGFIGANLIDGLLAEGYHVRAFDNNFRGRRDNLDKIIADVEVCEGDIRDYAAVCEAVKGCDHVYHLAFINGTEFFYKYPGLVMDVGIRGHFNVMDACRDYGVAKFVYASSSEIYQTPGVVPTPEGVMGVVPDVMNPRYSYGGAKLIGELLTFHYAEQADMQRIAFRPHNIYGPAMGFEHVIPQIIQKIAHATLLFKKTEATIPIQGTGDETRAFCHIKDAVKGILIAAEKGEDHNVYNVGNDRETRIADLVMLIAKHLETEITVVPGELQKGSTHRRLPDISKLKATGYVPSISLEQGLRQTVRWYRDFFIRKGDAI